MKHDDIIQPKPKTVPISTTSEGSQSVKDRNLLSGSLSFKLRERKSQNFGRSRQKNSFATQEAWVSENELLQSCQVHPETGSRGSYNGFPSLRKTGKSRERHRNGLGPILVPVRQNSDIDAFSDLVANEMSCQKAAMDAVRVKNVGGVFLPLDKYGAGRFTKHSGHSPTPSGDTFLLRPDGTWHREERPGRKTRHQSRSAKSEGALIETGSHFDRKELSTIKKKGVSNLKIRQETVCYGPKNSDVGYVGVHWKLTAQPKTNRSHHCQKTLGRVSRNVLPVTIGVDYRGTSVSKTRWAVPAMQTHEGAQVWFKGLNFVKQAVVDGSLSKCR